MKVTVVDPVPVKYSYRQPSLSRRGGVRLHPIKDGTAPIGEALTGMRFRDRAGNKLRDVVNPVTGYCTGVESALESEPRNQVGQPVRPGVSGTHTSYTRSICLEKRAAGDREYWTDEDGTVVRTVDMGESPIPLSRVCPAPKPQKERRVRKSTGRTGTSVPGASGPGGRITRSDCDALIRAMAKGRKIEITPAMRKDARRMLEGLRRKAAKTLAKG